MKKLFYICLFFCCIFTTAFAKDLPPSHFIKQRAFNAPNNLSKQNLTKYLVKPFKNDYDKIQVIAYWIASHIAYDGYKYNGTANIKELQYTYDTFQYRSGICTDYAKLFKEMAQLAGVKNVSYVTGHVIENAKRIKRKYTGREFSANSRHAWNEVYLNKRKFFVDTTFMSNSSVGWTHRRFPASFHHKMDIKKRKRQNSVNTNIDDFYADFTPQQELKKRHMLHVLDKYIK